MRSRLLGTALALTGDLSGAARLSGIALVRGGESDDAFLWLYRAYLYPFCGRDRRRHAAAVAIHHDGRTPEEAAILCGRSPEWVVRATTEAAAGSPGEAPDVAVTYAAETAYRRRRLLAAAGLLAVLAALFWPMGQTVQAKRPPYEHYGPAPQAVVVRYAIKQNGAWLVADDTEKRYILNDVDVDGPLAISPDGRRLAYNTTGDGPFILDLRGDRHLGIFEDHRDADRLVFSPDGTKLAAQWTRYGENVIQVTGSEPFRVSAETQLRGWITKGLVLADYGLDSSGDKIVDANGKKIAQLPDSPGHVSPDGATFADEDDGKIVLTGRLKREITLDLPPGVESVWILGWVGDHELLIMAPGFRSAYHRVDIDSGTVTPIPPDAVIDDVLFQPGSVVFPGFCEH